MISGVYKISNSLSEKVYIGGSNNIMERWAEHRRTLLNNTHHNILLQRFVNKYGIDKLSFEIIEECENYLEVEQRHLDSSKDLFNIASAASAPMLGRKHTEKALEKISKASTGKNNGMFGRKRRPHVIEKMQRARWVNGASKHERLKRIVNLPNRIEVIISKDDQTIHCFNIGHAAKIIGVAAQSVLGALRRKNGKTRGWTVVRANSIMYTERACMPNIDLFDEKCHPQVELIDALKSL